MLAHALHHRTDDVDKSAWLQSLYHEPGNSFARVGSAAGRVSSTNGRRLRSRHRTVSIFAEPISDGGGAHIFGVDVSLSREAGRGDQRVQTGDRDRSGVWESLQRHWGVFDRAKSV